METAAENKGTIKKYKTITLTLLAIVNIAVIITLFLSPLLWLVFTILILSVGLTQKRSIVSAIPAAVLLTFTYLICVGGIAGILHLNLYGNAALVKLTLGALTLLTFFLSIKRLDKLKHLKIATKYETIALAPTLLLIFIGVRYTLGTPSSWAERAYGVQDPIMHVLYTTVAIQDGAFLNSFDDKGLYPRGLHQVTALLSSATGITEPKELLPVLLTTVAAVAWVCLVVVSGTVSLLVVSLTKKIGGNLWLGVLLAVIACFAVNTGPFLKTFFDNGYYTTLLAVAAAITLMFESQNLKKIPFQTLLVSTACVFTAANAWQVVGVILGIVAIPILCYSSKRNLKLKTITGKISISFSILLLLLATIPVLTIIVVRSGSAGTGIGPTDPISALPAMLAILGVISLLILGSVKRFYKSTFLFIVSATSTLFIISACTLALRTRSLDTYYPNKTFFMGLLLSIPVAMGALVALTASNKGHNCISFIKENNIFKVTVPVAGCLSILVLVKFLLFFSVFEYTAATTHEISTQITKSSMLAHINTADAVFNIAELKEYSENSFDAGLQKSYGTNLDQHVALLLGYYPLITNQTTIQDRDSDNEGHMDIPAVLQAPVSTTECKALAAKPSITVFYNPIKDFNPASLPCPATLKNITWVNMQTGERGHQPIVP